MTNQLHELIEAGLKGGNLFYVDTPTLVERYNECLTSMGIAPAKLKKFNIDKMGWSPEIADEKDDELYLSHGEANVVGIILSLNQRYASVHFPYYSFDKFLLEKVYTELRKEIMDVTTQTGICLDMENGISRFHVPGDLLMINSFVVLFHTPGGLAETAEKQKEMVLQFEESKELWMDESFREKIIKSAQEHGDLRYRRIMLNPVYFNDVSSFYTRAFGGVFVFRDCAGDSPEKEFLVLLDKEAIKEAPDYEQIFYAGDKELVRNLFEKNIIEMDIDYYIEHTEKLKNIKEDILAEFLCCEYPEEMDFGSLTRAEKKKYINIHHQELPEIFFELERTIAYISRGKKPAVSDALKFKLAGPGLDISSVCKESVWTLLSVLDPVNLIRLYRFNKAKFYEDYKTWPTAKKNWASFHVLRDYKVKA